jgi:hypothetical protein
MIWELVALRTTLRRHQRQFLTRDRRTSRWKIDNAPRFFHPVQVARFYVILILCGLSNRRMKQQPPKCSPEILLAAAKAFAKK